MKELFIELMNGFCDLTVIKVIGGLFVMFLGNVISLVGFVSIITISKLIKG